MYTIVGYENLIKHEKIWRHFFRKTGTKICLKEEKLPRMLSEHCNPSMFSRNAEKYKVQFTHPGSLDKSPIIYMSRKLNHEESKTR